MDNIFYLINVNDVKGLSEVIFNKKLTSDSPKCYASCMSNQEEVELVKQLLQTNDKRWLDFIEKYIEHYPLSTEACILLAQHLTEEKERLLVIEHLQKYGANEKESLTLFQSLKAGDFKDENLLRILCEYSRIFYQSLFNQLDLIDERWSHRYLLATKSNY